MREKRFNEICPEGRQNNGMWVKAANGIDGLQTFLRRHGWIFGLFLLAATMTAYQPVWHAGFIWDDDDYVTQNLALRSAGGLAQIWCNFTATPQYYPLVYTSFWLEYHLWGLNPLGYHVVNVLLHSLAAILLWRVLVQVQLPGARLAAGIFALHPVAVESVAWVTERKNVLAAVFYFAAALAYLRWMEPENRMTKDKWGSLRLYFIALALFIAALFSKTITCSLPAAMLLAVWWKRGRIVGRDVWPLLPLFAAGLAMGLVTSWLEQTHVGARGPEWDFSFSERCLIAGRALWFYAGKLFWPVDLTFIYPRWQLNVAAWWQWIFPVTALALVAALWRLRQRIGRGPMVAVMYFGGTLLPALGFKNFFPMRFSFVADHFQYLAGTGLLALAASGITTAFGLAGKRNLLFKQAFCCALLLTLGVLTWRQSRMYSDLETLWRTTIDRNPACWMAYNNLGNVLLHKMQLAGERRSEQMAPASKPDIAGADEVIHAEQQALAIKPDIAAAYFNLGAAFVLKGQIDEAITNYQTAIGIKPDYAEAYSDLGYALLQQGQTNEAIGHYATAVRIKPHYAVAQRGLAFLLSNNGLFSDAIAHYKAAIFIDPQNGWDYHGLGSTFLKMGRVSDAMPVLLKAVETDPQNAAYKDDLGGALFSSHNVTAAVSNFLATARADPAGFGHFLAAVESDTNHIGLINNLAWLFATNPDPKLRNGKYAVRLAIRTCEMTDYQATVCVGTLAAAYAEAGRYDEAALTAQKACALASEHGETDLLKRNQELLTLYQAHQPYHESVKASSP